MISSPYALMRFLIMMLFLNKQGTSAVLLYSRSLVRHPDNGPLLLLRTPVNKSMLFTAHFLVFGFCKGSLPDPLSWDSKP